jgi:tRNA 5-methylaminomethyl-2-thiouridine biosynthesis bifunctional protein
VFDAGAAAASASPAALVTPRLDAGLGPQAALFAQAFARACDLYAAHDEALIATGALQLAVGPKDGRRFAAIAGSDLFEPGAMRVTEPPALAINGAMVVEPAPILAAWIGERTNVAVAGLSHDGTVWRLLGADGETIAEVEIVCVACGMASASLVPRLPLRPVRGQTSFIPGASAPATVLFGGYVAPARGGVILGATHDRDEVSLEARPEDHQRNLAALAEVLPELAARLEGRTYEAYVGVRATTADYLPLAGPGELPGLFVLTGLGSRGFTLAPLLAEHVAALALGAPSPLPTPLADLVDPARFERRARRRGR